MSAVDLKPLDNAELPQDNVAARNKMPLRHNEQGLYRNGIAADKPVTISVNVATVVR